MKNQTIIKFIQKASNFKSMATDNQVQIESSFATPGSIFAKVDSILWAIAAAKHNKSHLVKFVPVVKQLTKVLNGADASFIRQAEFYSDLKGTLNKIEHQINECKTRGKWANKLMAKKDQKTVEEVEHHVDLIITRIVFAFAQRAERMNIARRKKLQKQQLNFSSIEEEDEMNESLNRSDTSSETTSVLSEESVSGER
jgi:hypothetical protein